MLRYFFDELASICWRNGGLPFPPTTEGAIEMATEDEIRDLEKRKLELEVQKLAKPFFSRLPFILAILPLFPSTFGNIRIWYRIRGAEIASMINTIIPAPIPADARFPIVSVVQYY